MQDADTDAQADAPLRGIAAWSTKKRYALVVGVFVIVVSLVAWGRRNPEEGPRIPLRIGISPWPGYEFGFLAREKGYFADEGMDVRILEFSCLGDARRAYERGQLDAFFGTVVELLQAEDNGGHRPRAALVTDYSSGADVIMAPKKYGTMADLRGKRIGYERLSLNGFLLARALELSQMTMNDVTPVPIEQAHMARSLAEGVVDAVVTYPPVSVHLEAAGYSSVFSSQAIPREIVDLLIVDEAVFERKPNVVQGLRRAYWRAQDYVRAHESEAYALFARREGLTPQEVGYAISSGLTLVDERTHASFFGTAGSLARNIDDVGAALFSTHQIEHPPKPGATLIAREVR